MDKIKPITNIRLDNYDQKKEDNTSIKKAKKSSFNFDELLKNEEDKLNDQEFFQKQKQKLR